jgi:MerR family transcriptional regulator, light-induced transcriptional regulator
MTDQTQLTIGDLVARTGVSEGTLRMWERRHGFPSPARLPSGHRRYSEADATLVLQVVRERAAGLSLPSAIARAHASAAELEPSVFAGLRRRRPDLQPVTLRKPLLLALSRAIEDESCARAERPLLFGAFQRERFYRQSERRWREFSRTAELAVVFADFEQARLPADGPVELPVDRSAPLGREWAVVCEAAGHAACLAGVELPPSRRRREPAREFDVIWSVEPEVVRAASEICVGLARRSEPRLADRLGDREVAPAPPLGEQLRLSAAITTRMLGALA